MGKTEGKEEGRGRGVAVLAEAGMVVPHFGRGVCIGPGALTMNAAERGSAVQEAYEEVAALRQAGLHT
eukprot:365139-Chlamydomonas_euryale.AAC.21